MPPTVAGNEYERLDDFIGYILGLGEYDKDYIFELVGPDYIAHVPRDLFLKRVARQNQGWENLSLYDQGEIVAIQRIDGLERIAESHLVKVHYAKKETYGSGTGGSTFRPGDSRGRDLTKPKAGN